MMQYWEVCLTGGRKRYILQKIERLLQKKTYDLSETTETWENKKINVIKFKLELKSKNLEEAFFESSIIAEKLYHSWNISGISNGNITASCETDYFAISEIKYAKWQLNANKTHQHHK